MSIPNFKNKEDCDIFLKMFEDRLAVKVAMLNRVREELYPKFEWVSLPPSSLETINDITQSLLYDVEYTFKAEYPEYKTDDDEMFIPRRSFKEDCAEALKEALRQDCPPCDTLTCVDHLTDE
jgi:hypothetical protein